MAKVSDRLAAMELKLPVALKPLANYVPYRLSGNMLTVSGQLCLDPDGNLAERYKGKVGSVVSADVAAEAARLCALNVLSQVADALGGIDAAAFSCVRLGGFVNADPQFLALAQVMNGASDLMVAVLGENGKHTRSTIGVAVLPLDAAVEVEATFEISIY